jgi:hypothetical protein
MATDKNGDGNGGSGFSVSADKYRLVVKAQRELIEAIAGRVDRGEPVARTDERNLIAGILRAWAHRIPDALPDAAGGAPRIDPAFVAIHFACLVNVEGHEASAATAELAEIYGVSASAISDAVAKFEKPAMRLVPKAPT